MKELITKMQEQFNRMCSTNKLFRAKITGDEIYNKYLESFPEGSNPVFRDPSSSTHNCNNCKNFIRRYGNIVSINENGQTESIFTVTGVNSEYGTVATAIDTLIKSKEIENVFMETYDTLDRSLNYEKCTKSQNVYRLGVSNNFKQYTKEEADKYGVVSPGEIREFSHMHVDLPKVFVDKSGSSIEAIMGQYRDKYQVFKRAMEEISLDTLNLVEDLISQGSLLDGTAHVHTIKDAIKYKRLYDQIGSNYRDNWLWEISYSLDERTAKFRNTLIGVLCTELTEGKELNAACESWNKRVDPANYHKATAPITKRQIEEAAKFVEENGYEESFSRRLATIDDINVTEIKHISSSSEVSKVTIFDNVKATSTQHKRAKYDDVEEVPIEKFMSDILPKCTSVEALLLNNHEGNLVTLTTTNSKESKPIFKWGNNYSWNFNGNLAGKSQIKDAVASKGGKVDGVLRFSIMWAEGDPSDNSDLDAHAIEPKGEHIYYGSSYRKDHGNVRTRMTGQLDVDITNPQSYHNKNIVENIAWTDISRMGNGVYKLYVNQFADRGSKGFRAEIEFDGQIYTYEYNRKVAGNVQVAEVTLNNGLFTIKHLLPETASNKELWGLETNTFHKVNLVCLSPNHWGENAVGNKHYFLMLENCKTDKDVRGFHNENLLPELLKHRKVMEVLGATNVIKVTGKENQLSGIGFNSTVRDEVVLKLKGTHNRMIKVKF